MGRTSVNLNAIATFIADPQSIDRVPGGRQIDWANVDSSHRTTPGVAPFTVTAAAAAQGATALTVTALPGPLPANTLLDFGTDELVVVTTAAAAGATSLVVRALVSALEGAETAAYAGTPGSGDKVLPAGTPVGSALGSGKVSPRVVTSNPAIGLLETNAVENDKTASLSGYGIINGGNIYVNLLPVVWLTGTPKVLISAVATELNTAGVGDFKFFQYTDTR